MAIFEPVCHMLVIYISKKKNGVLSRIPSFDFFKYINKMYMIKNSKLKNLNIYSFANK